MAVATRVYKSGVWQAYSAITPSVYAGGAWNTCKAVAVHAGGSWVTVWLSMSLNGPYSKVSATTPGSFILGVTVSNGATPSAYSWSTTAGTLSSTTNPAPTLSLGATIGNSNTATVTCNVTLNGTVYSPSADYTFTNAG